MIYVESVGGISRYRSTRTALAPQWRLLETPNDRLLNVFYDPQAMLALPHAGCRVTHLTAVMVTHDTILPPATPVDHIGGEDARKRRVRP